MSLTKTKSILIVCTGYFIWICVDTILWIYQQPNIYIFILEFNAIKLIAGILICILLILSEWKIIEKYSSNRYVSFVLKSAMVVMFSVILASFSILDEIYLTNFKYNFQFRPLLSGIFNSLVLISSLIGLFYVVFYSSLNAYQKEQVAKTKALADEAQLLMLRYQINPHFLFNSLNAIQSMIEKDKNRAKEMIADLSEFFRYTLSKNNQTLVPLKEEIEAVKKYLSIQKDRFANRIEIEFKIEETAYNIKLPFFIIHPLVENAIKYGFASSIDVLQLLIQVTLDGQTASILVKNNGTLNQAGNNSDNGMISTKTGIENIKKRLALFYPDCSSFELFEKEYCVYALIKITHPSMSV